LIRFKRLPTDITKTIEDVIGHLKQHPDVIFAYLFGGLMRKHPSPLSDVDIAIYVKDPKRFNYLEFYTTLTNLINTEELDLVVLNTAPVSLAGRVLRLKRLLVDKDPFIRHRYESLTLRKFFDFQILERRGFRRRYGIG
jgi:hypothetical protein